jgi:hypothetical protein
MSNGGWLNIASRRRAIRGTDDSVSPTTSAVGGGVHEVGVPLGDDGRCQEARDLAALLVVLRAVGDQDRVVLEVALRDGLGGEAGLRGGVAGAQHLAGGLQGPDAPQGADRLWFVLV